MGLAYIEIELRERESGRRGQEVWEHGWMVGLLSSRGVRG